MRNVYIYIANTIDASETMRPGNKRQDYKVPSQERKRYEVWYEV